MNQLIGLAAAARHDVLLVSDSNVRAPAGYLRDVAAHLADPGVGLVTHPVGGVGEASLGAALDNLHAAAGVGPATVAVKRLSGRDVVVGKSMAFRRGDLEALGGFESVRDVLAEDYVLGVNVSRRLGKRVAIGSVAIPAVSERRSGRTSSPGTAAGASCSARSSGRRSTRARSCSTRSPSPWPGWPSRPAPTALAAAVLVWLAKAVLDGATARTLRGSGFGARVLWLSPLKDLLFLVGVPPRLLENTVEWRGNRLLVLAGSRLERVRCTGRGRGPGPRAVTTRGRPQRAARPGPECR